MVYPYSFYFNINLRSKELLHFSYVCMINCILCRLMRTNDQQISQICAGYTTTMTLSGAPESCKSLDPEDSQIVVDKTPRREYYSHSICQELAHSICYQSALFHLECTTTVQYCHLLVHSFIPYQIKYPDACEITLNSLLFLIGKSENNSSGSI